MKIRLMFLLATGLFLSLPAALPQVQAHPLAVAPGPDEPKTKPLVVKSSRDAVQRVSRQFQGQVLKIDAARVNGHPGYRVKLLTDDGQIFYVSVDAQTGAVKRN
jgi:uncharacterized membrane protein YkoI